jgi:hypothetical protein
VSEKEPVWERLKQAARSAPPEPPLVMPAGFAAGLLARHRTVAARPQRLVEERIAWPAALAAAALSLVFIACNWDLLSLLSSDWPSPNNFVQVEPLP